MTTAASAMTVRFGARAVVLVTGWFPPGVQPCRRGASGAGATTRSGAALTCGREYMRREKNVRFSPTTSAARLAPRGASACGARTDAAVQLRRATAAVDARTLEHHTA